MSHVRFDDIDGLKALVGEQPRGGGPPIQVTQAMIDAFADLSGDRQWIHVDPERCARESPLGVPIAHGMLLVSLAVARGQHGEPQITGFGNAIHYGIDELRFLRPVVAGSRVLVQRRVVHARRKGRGGSQLTFEVTLRTETDEGPALRFRSTVVLLP